VASGAEESEAMRQEVVVRARRHEAGYEQELEEKFATALARQSAEMVAQSQALHLQTLQFSEQAVTHVAHHQTQYLDLMENELREHMVMMRNEDAQKEEAFQYQMSVELAIRVQEHSNQVLAVQRNEVHEIEPAAYRRLQSAITNEQERFAQRLHIVENCARHSEQELHDRLVRTDDRHQLEFQSQRGELVQQAQGLRHEVMIANQ
jgi:6-pyruvoyl-tetrahydropterin synthase